MLRRICFLVAVVLLNAHEIAAQTAISGPSVGLFFDPNVQTIRPILGIPGAATAGPPIDLGATLAAATMSPSQDYILGVFADGSLQLVALPVNGPAGPAVSLENSAPDKIALSPIGTSAAFYYAGSATVQIVTGLPNTPLPIGQLDLSVLPSPPDVIAISDDGLLLLAGVRENPDGAPPQGELFAFAGAAAPQSIASVQHVSAIAFAAHSHDALFADDAASSVTLLQDAGNSANTLWVFTGHLSAPDSVLASVDHKTFLVGSSTGSTVTILDAHGSNPNIISCGCAPKELRPLSATSVYQLTEPGGDLLWILDGQATGPRTVFVPIPSNPASATINNRGTGTQ